MMQEGKPYMFRLQNGKPAAGSFLSYGNDNLMAFIDFKDNTVKLGYEDGEFNGIDINDFIEYSSKYLQNEFKDNVTVTYMLGLFEVIITHDSSYDCKVSKLINSINDILEDWYSIQIDSIINNIEINQFSIKLSFILPDHFNLRFNYPNIRFEDFELSKFLKL